MSPDDHAAVSCEQCGAPAARGAMRFCSQECWRAWERDNAMTDPATARRKRAYGRWYRMVDRCINPANPHWARYGGRGIVVCEKWLTSFDAYYADTGDAPTGMSLDRVDNDGPYAPANVRWATARQQRANQERDPGRSKTHCSQGHEFTPENTHVDARGWRSCRACGRAKSSRQRAQKAVS